MPNWVLNRILIKGSKDDLTSIADFVKGDESKFDFDKIIPMPKELLEVESVFQSEYEKLSDEEKQPYISNEEKYGYRDWYYWRWANWGTKWNACDVRGPYITNTETENFLDCVFKTAWAAPFPMINKIAELYPDTWIEHSFADENIGYNCGYLVKNPGETSFEVKFAGNGNEESERFALVLWDYEYLNEEADKEENESDEDS